MIGRQLTEVWVRGVSRPAANGVSMGSGRHGTEGTSLDEFADPPGEVGDDEHALSDRDQTASDRDQTESDGDQTASDRDEAASAGDQEAADRDLAGGGDPVEHELNREVRQRASAERLIRAAVRDKTALERLQVAAERDQIAELRESLSAANDLTLRDALGGGVFLRAEEARAKAASDRAAAASDRRRAADDRETAASLRAAAARDRRQAAQERKLAGIDQLTGVSLRAVGLGEIEAEIQRARRTRMPLALAFVDVNRLKAVNDTQGHLAGDGLLKQVAEALRTKLRPYDVIVRFGGDEFVCALANMDAADVRGRFADIIETLETNGYPAPISFGVADLEDGDDLERLLARADADLIETRHIAGHGADRGREAQRSSPRARSARQAAKPHGAKTQQLRVLIANQRADRLARLAEVVGSLGHQVIASEIHVGNEAAGTARLRPDVALVGLGVSSEHALEMIGEIVAGAYCPVIALLWEYDAEWITQAAERGVYAYIVDTRPEELQSAIDITLRRFVELQALQSAFERSNAELARESQQSLTQRRQMLELHQDVVQSLAVAKLELDLNHSGASHDALTAAFEKTRTIVSRSLEQLRAEGAPLTELLGDASPSQL
jgi:diguanylate cyclase (GGDEF)-like protein